jgi:hypothetical protein
VSGDHDEEQSAGLEVCAGRDAFGAGRDLTLYNYFATRPSPLPGEDGRRSASGVRVSDADPRRLGVHTAISAGGAG